MTQKQSQTNANKVGEIRDSLIAKYLSRKCSEIIDSDHFDFASAKKQIERLLVKRTSSEDAVSYHSAMGVLYAAQGKFFKAKTEYEKVIKLVPRFGDHFLNFNSILIGVSDFEVAKQDLEECFSKDENNFAILLNLFYCCRWSLEFSSFRKYYEIARDKSILPPSSKDILEFHYQSIEQWEELKTDLPSIGISIELYSEFYSLLNIFQARNFYNSLDICFEIDEDDQCLVVDVYSNISDSEALILISNFESYMVQYSIKNNRRELLSKFLVFFKDRRCYQEDFSDIYLRSNYVVV